MLTGQKWTQDTIQTDVQPVLHALIYVGMPRRGWPARLPCGRRSRHLLRKLCLFLSIA